jgi:excisionase family DNA binding protein
MEMLTLKEAADLLGVSRQHLYTLEKRGKLRIVRNPAYLKGPARIPREDVERILAKGRET